MKKQTAIDSLKQMPQDFELDDFFERLVVIDKIEKGKQDVESGRTFTHQEAKSKLKKWLR